MATTKTSLFGDYPSALFEAFGTPIGNLRRQRKADCKPKKPKPVTDEQLLAIVDELEAKIKTQASNIAALEALMIGMARTAQVDELEVYVKANYKLKIFAPVRHYGGSH
jgi:hypothetical protein